MTVKNSDVLTAARRLISDPKNWTTEYLARDKDGKETTPNSPFACSWCAVGAKARAEKIFGVHCITSMMRSLDDSAVAINPRGPLSEAFFGLRPIAVLNDEVGHAAVLRAYDLAIEAEKAREFAEEIDRIGKDDA